MMLNVEMMETGMDIAIMSADRALLRKNSRMRTTSVMAIRPVM